MPRVLIADDDPLIRLTLRAMLERHGHRVAEAHDGGECLRRITSEFFDLCVMDLAMRGPELNDRLAAARAVSMPVLVLSGHGSPLLREEHSTVAFERKPVGVESLEAALGRLGFALRTAGGD